MQIILQRRTGKEQPVRRPQHPERLGQERIFIFQPVRFVNHDITPVNASEVGLFLEKYFEKKHSFGEKSFSDPSDRWHIYVISQGKNFG